MSNLETAHHLESHHIKATSNRIRVFETLLDSARPLSLIEIEERLDTVDRSVISRTLALLRKNQLVHVIDGGSDSVRYEACHSDHKDGCDDDQHAHFYCEKCHLTFCMDEFQVPEVSFPKGFQVHNVSIMVKGICPSCLEALEAKH